MRVCAASASALQVALPGARNQFDCFAVLPSVNRAGFVEQQHVHIARQLSNGPDTRTIAMTLAWIMAVHAGNANRRQKPADRRLEIKHTEQRDEHG